MKKNINIILLLTFLLVCINSKLEAKSEYHPNYIGLNPSLTIEPFYEKGEMDINIIPLVYQRPLTKIIDIRLASICNLGFRNAGNEISHFGLEMAFPLFFTKKDDKRESSKGFFVAPIMGLTRNRLENHNNIGLWIEPGYNLLFENRFAISFGLQVGGTYFIYDNSQDKWGPHFGIKIILGKWF